MTGLTNNADLLAAMNQQVQAINDLCSCLTVSVITNVSVGVSLEQEEGLEGDPPPAGAGEPDPITERKCVAAEVLWRDVDQILNNLVDNPLSVGWFDLVTFSLFLQNYVEQGTLLLSQINLGIYGWLVDWASYVVSFDAVVSYTDMRDDWFANKASLICAMYNSVSPTDALVDLLAVLTGLTTSEKNFIALLLPNDALNVLYFSVGTSESVLSSYTATFDCSGCCPLWQPIQGSIIGQSGNTWTWQSNLMASPDRQQVQWKSNNNVTSYCGPQVRATAGNLVGWINGPFPFNDFRAWNQVGTQVYDSESPFNNTCAGQFAISGDPSSVFTVDITIGDDC